MDTIDFLDTFKNMNIRLISNKLSLALWFSVDKAYKRFLHAMQENNKEKENPKIDLWKQTKHKTNLFMVRRNVVFQLVLMSISLPTIWVWADMIVLLRMCFHM